MTTETINQTDTAADNFFGLFSDHEDYVQADRELHECLEQVGAAIITDAVKSNFLTNNTIRKHITPLVTAMQRWSDVGATDTEAEEAIIACLARECHEAGVAFIQVDREPFNFCVLTEQAIYLTQERVDQALRTLKGWLNTVTSTNVARRLMEAQPQIAGVEYEVYLLQLQLLEKHGFQGAKARMQDLLVSEVAASPYGAHTKLIHTRRMTAMGRAVQMLLDLESKSLLS